MAATVLVVDGGGRAAALAQKYSQSKHVKKLLIVPGNDLIFKSIKKPTKIFPHLKTTDTSEIVEIAKQEKVDLADVAQDDVDFRIVWKKLALKFLVRLNQPAGSSGIKPGPENS